jgi:light-regulated signal transduction histidine kinase (bacteriophytochrome)
VASHDLQEPLRKIQAFGDRLKTRVADHLTPEASDYLSRMQSAAARMQGLIDGLLMYSRVLTRAQPFTQVALATVVKEVVEDLEVRIEKTGASVQVGDLPSIEADALQIRQLLQNLIGNALKFQPAGNKPQVSISARIISGARWANESTGSTELLTKRKMCELSVSDNGIGFDETYLKRLFVVFQRLHSRSEFEGTGIGLAVCRKIATRHGGFITARSKPGEGATFLVLLPLTQQTDNGGSS